MESETSTHSFIVRIWLEETDAATGAPLWRGYVTHVLSKQQRYFTTLDELVGFFRPYLSGPDVPPFDAPHD